MLLYFKKILKKIQTYLYNLETKTDKTIYLSVFRIYIAIHIIKKMIFALPILDLIYGKQNFIILSSTDLFGILNLNFFREHIFIIVFSILILSILFLFGIGKNLTVFFLYILIEIIQRLNPYHLNGGDNLLKFILLYLCFIDCYSYFCINNSKRNNNINNVITNLGILSIQFHLCLIYFLTGLHKTHADVWFNGIATYYTLSLERFQGTNLNSILAKNGWFVTLTTYFTVFWELTFSFFIFNKTYRIFAITGGLIVHLFIYIFMMIHDFQILYIMIYGIFYSDSDFKKWFNYFKIKKHETKFS